MEGYQVVTMDDARRVGDIFVTATGCIDVITPDHLRRDEAPGHRLQHRPLRPRSRSRRCEQQAGRTSSRRSTSSFPRRQALIVLAEGRLVNLGCATGHPSFVMTSSFTNQVMAQIELVNLRQGQVREEGLHAAEAPRREGRRAAPGKLGAKLTKLTPKQAEYLGIPAEGPFKPENYRY